MPITISSQMIGDSLGVFWSEEADIERMHYGRTDTPPYEDERTQLIMVGDSLGVFWSEEADIERMGYGWTSNNGWG